MASWSFFNFFKKKLKDGDLVQCKYHEKCTIDCGEKKAHKYSHNCENMCIVTVEPRCERIDGFTVIELLIVISIVAILIAIAIPGCKEKICYNYEVEFPKGNTTMIYARDIVSTSKNGSNIYINKKNGDTICAQTFIKKKASCQ